MPTQSALRVFSYGGGVQSTAALVLAATGRLDYSTFIFSNVGADSENPKTLAYFHEYAIPYAKKHNLTLIETQWTGERGPKKGLDRTLYADIMQAERSVDIPVKLQSGDYGNRKCTARYKIEPVAKWTEEHGATPENPAILGLGISWDESQRIATSRTPHHINDYPFCDLRKRINRADCKQIILEAGLPVPPKSSCFFCPFKSENDWVDLYDHEPELFALAIALEDHINLVRNNLGLDEVYLGPMRRLTQLHSPATKQLSLFQGCDSGHCWT